MAAMSPAPVTAPVPALSSNALAAVTRRAFSCVTPGNVPAGNPATTCMVVRGGSAARAKLAVFTVWLSSQGVVTLGP